MSWLISGVLVTVAMGLLVTSVNLWGHTGRTPSRARLSYIAGIGSLVAMFAAMAFLG